MTRAARLRAGARARRRARPLRRRLRSARGQTTTEYLMIAGFATALGIFVIRVMQKPFEGFLAQMVSYVINNAADLPW